MIQTFQYLLVLIYIEKIVFGQITPVFHTRVKYKRDRIAKLSLTLLYHHVYVLRFKIYNVNMKNKR